MGNYLLRLVDQRPNAAIEAALAQATAKALAWFPPETFGGPWSTTGLSITNLRAKHVAVTNQASGLQGGVAASAVFGVTAVTASTWTSWISLNVDDRAYQVITGVFNKEPKPRITAIQPTANGQDLEIVSLEDMYTWDMAHAYFIQPYVVSPGKQHKVQVFSGVTLAGIPSEQIGLIGYVVGRREYLIQQ